MTTAITLAGPGDFDRVLALATRYREEAGGPVDPAALGAAIAPILDGTAPHGAIWLIGPARAPLGHVVVSFGWSLDLGGMEGWLQETYIRPSVRGRGIGTEVIHAIAVNLGRGGLRALHARLPETADRARNFCRRAGFRDVPGQMILSDIL